jgi:hypothetical protein
LLQGHLNVNFLGETPQCTTNDEREPVGEDDERSEYDDDEIGDNKLKGKHFFVY